MYMSFSTDPDLWSLASFNLQYSQLLSCGIIGIFLLYVSGAIASPWKQNVIKNSKGEHIKEYPKDTRAMRFSHGKELSEAGKALAGNDPYIVKNGKFRELVIFAPEHLQEFLRKDSKDHQKAKNFNMGDYAGRILGQCVGQQHGPKWRTMRSHFDPEFSHSSSLKMLPTFSKTTTSWVEGLCSGGAEGEGKKKHDVFTVDVVKECKMLAFRLIAMSVYGEALTEEIFNTLITLSKLHGQVLLTAIFKPLTQWRLYNLLPTPEKKILDSFTKQWAEFNDMIIKDARARNLSCPAEVIFHGVDTTSSFSRTEFLQTLDEMLFSNIEITGSIMAFTLINLAKDSALQGQLLAEIRAKEKEKGYSVGEYVAKQDTLLHFATLESMRVTPAMWFSPPECTSLPKTIGGYQIPPHTPVILDVRRLNTSRSVWGDDAESFRPTRFESKPATDYRYALLRWGIGPGKCMGKNMADLMLKLVVLSLIPSYNLSPPPPKAGEEGEQKKGGYTVAAGGEVEFRRL